MEFVQQARTGEQTLTNPMEHTEKVTILSQYSFGPVMC